MKQCRWFYPPGRLMPTGVLLIIATTLVGVVEQCCAATGVAVIDRPITRDATPDTLRAIGGAIEANYEKIHLWDGEYALKDVSTESASRMNDLLARLRQPRIVPNGADVATEYSGNVVFSVDTKLDKLFVEVASNRCTFSQAGVELKIPLFNETGEVRSLLFSDEFFTFNPGLRFATPRQLGDSGQSARYLFRKGPEEGKRLDQSDVIDPRTFWLVGGSSLPDTLQHAAQYFIHSGLWEIGGVQAQMTGRTISGHNVYTTTWPFQAKAGEVLISTMSFDESVGLNIVSASESLKSGVPVTMREWSYQNKDGIFIPSYFRRIVYSDGKPRFDRTLELIKTVVNGRADPDAFSVARLGLSAGDRMKDEITGKETVYNGKTWIPVVPVIERAVTDAEIAAMSGQDVNASGALASPPMAQEVNAPTSRRAFIVEAGASALGLAVLAISAFIWMRKRGADKNI